ncbi:substrate-binding periplasmic protein [Tabrizicola soli]|uniref:Substrate-binding periplasmic protein n=1 Tax=Tabrizicola soli TaxID=2185115 RepID=A0ABV7DR86_9RHOB|nr:ABC transporter substrate-binding protein [Tabrizicola soli]
MIPRMTLAAALLICASPLAAQDCTPTVSFPTVEEGYLTIAAVTYAPYSYIDTNGQMQGVDGAIAAEIAKLACLEVKAVPSDAASGIQSVIAGKADISTGDWYRTAERARVVLLSAPLYVDQMAIYSKAGHTKFADIESGTVGSVQGNLWVNDLREILGENLKLYPDSVAMQQDLVAGRLDAAVDGNSIGVVAQAQGGLEGIQIKVIEPDERIGASQEAGQGTFPINKDNAEMLAGMDAAIKQLHETGKIAEILAAHGLDASAAETGEPRLIE